MGDKVLYLCDPSLNVRCRKMSCFIHRGPCRYTKDQAYAVLDEQGGPIKVMSTKNGVWHNAAQDLPPESEEWVQVLVVKQNKSGTRKLEIAQYLASRGWVTSNGKGEVLYWMPLPKIPED